MAAFAGTMTVHEAFTGPSIVANSPYQYKEIIAFSDNTLTHTNTFTINLTSYGITTMWMIKAYIHTTEGQVIILDAEPTTAVADGVLTVTVNGSGGAKARAFIIGGV